jgi:hypothetical protein
MSLKLLQRVVALCCVMSIAGMIVTNIRDNIGGAMAFGLFGASAMVVLMVVNAVLRNTNHGGAQDSLAAELEARVAELIAAGADEAAVRSIVGKAVRLGRGEIERTTQLPKAPSKGTKKQTV